LKRNIFSSVDNYLSNIDTSLGKYKEFENRTNSNVSKIPKLEAALLGFERKFQIAEKLYLFLLERREEASISYEATLPNTRVINGAYTAFIPVAPKKQIVFLGAILLGLLIPFGILFLLKSIDTKIHTREDLEKLIPNIDIMGEVPFVEDIQSITDSRGIFAESSRVIRSNISFKLNREQSNVILCTSSIKGEGKTLTAFNTAASYVATGKKVLLIGADLRNPQLHTLINIDRKSNLKGLSTLIANASLEVSKDTIETLDLFNNQLDILLSGPIPPNPAELLNSKVFSNLLAELKKSYDYIIIDSAPLVLVSDTLPLLEQADLVLYTSRAHYTDKKLIPFIKGLVEDKKATNIGIVFNGIKAGASSYYKYGYSYRYSYQYKYNYGYGYGYGEDKS
jgi:tyrosine-protein kinase Etk/Wzc